MPTLLKSKETYLRGEDYVFSRQFFDLLAPNTLVKFEIIDDNSGSYAIGGAYVRIANSKRADESSWFKKKVIYHEFGHCIDAQRQLRNSDEIKKLMKEQKASLKKDERYYIWANELDRKSNTWIKVRESRTGSRIAVVERRLKGIFRKIYNMNDATFTKRGITKNDVIEQITSTMDTIMSIDANYGFGHTKSYFKQAGNKETEYIAHAFENAFIGNKVFEKCLPDVYAEMIDIIKQLKPL